jgi:hypothetical protein
MCRTRHGGSETQRYVSRDSHTLEMSAMTIVTVASVMIRAVLGLESMYCLICTNEDVMGCFIGESKGKKPGLRCSSGTRVDPLRIEWYGESAGLPTPGASSPLPLPP